MVPALFDPGQEKQTDDIFVAVRGPDVIELIDQTDQNRPATRNDSANVNTLGETQRQPHLVLGADFARGSSTSNVIVMANTASASAPACANVAYEKEPFR